MVKIVLVMILRQSALLFGKNTDNDSCGEENSSEDNVNDTEQVQRADDGYSQDSDEDIAGTPPVFRQASLDDEQATESDADDSFSDDSQTKYTLVRAKYR